MGCTLHLSESATEKGDPNQGEPGVCEAPLTLPPGPQGASNPAECNEPRAVQGRPSCMARLPAVMSVTAGSGRAGTRRSQT